MHFLGDFSKASSTHCLKMGPVSLTFMRFWEILWEILWEIHSSSCAIRSKLCLRDGIEAQDYIACNTHFGSANPSVADIYSTANDRPTNGKPLRLVTRPMFAWTWGESALLDPELRCFAAALLCKLQGKLLPGLTLQEKRSWCCQAKELTISKLALKDGLSVQKKNRAAKLYVQATDICQAALCKPLQVWSEVLIWILSTCLETP